MPSPLQLSLKQTNSKKCSFQLFPLQLPQIIFRRKQRVNLGPWMERVGFLGGSVVRDLPAMQKTEVMLQVWSLGQEDPLEEGVATHSSVPVLRNPMDRGAWRAVCSPWGHTVDTTEAAEFANTDRVPQNSAGHIQRVSLTQGGAQQSSAHTLWWGGSPAGSGQHLVLFLTKVSSSFLSLLSSILPPFLYLFPITYTEGSLMKTEGLGSALGPARWLWNDAGYSTFLNLRLPPCTLGPHSKAPLPPRLLWGWMGPHTLSIPTGIQRCAIKVRPFSSFLDIFALWTQFPALKQEFRQQADFKCQQPCQCHPEIKIRVWVSINWIY